MIKKNIGVIGCGFIGEALVKELVKNKDYDIRVLDRNSNINNFPIKWIKNDYTDKLSISEFILELDILIHLASSTVPASSSLSSEIDIKANISAMLQILDLAKKINPQIYIIFASSASVYGNQVDFPITEKNIPKPISFYGLQKLSIEHILRIYYQQYNISFASCRISNAYGPGQKNHSIQGLLSIIKDSYEKDKKVVIYGANECTRDFIHISDVAEAFTSLCKNQPINCEVNISSGVETRILDLLKQIEEINRKKVLLEYKEFRKFDIKRSVLDNSLIRSLVGWKPTKKLYQGIKEFMINIDI